MVCSSSQAATREQLRAQHAAGINLARVAARLSLRERDGGLAARASEALMVAMAVPQEAVSHDKRVIGCVTGLVRGGTTLGLPWVGNVHDDVCMCTSPSATPRWRWLLAMWHAPCPSSTARLQVQRQQRLKQRHRQRKGPARCRWLLLQLACTRRPATVVCQACKSPHALLPTRAVLGPQLWPLACCPVSQCCKGVVALRAAAHCV